MDIPNDDGFDYTSYFSPVDRILPNLYLGNLSAANDKPTLKFCGVTHIIQTIDGEHGFPDDFKYLKLDTYDSEDYQIHEHFESTYDFIERAMNESDDSVIFVHCAAGASRSASIVIAYLMRKLGLPFNAALKFVQDRRKIVQPNEGFMKQLENYEKTLGK